MLFLLIIIYRDSIITGKGNRRRWKGQFLPVFVVVTVVDDVVVVVVVIVSVVLVHDCFPGFNRNWQRKERWRLKRSVVSCGCCCHYCHCCCCCCCCCCCWCCYCEVVIVVNAQWGLKIPDLEEKKKKRKNGIKNG